MGFSLKNFDVNGACDEELRKASGEDENVMRQKLAISFLVDWRRLIRISL